MSADNSVMTIDHNYYPHVIDAIVAYLDFAGLKTASSAGGAWRNVAECVKGRLAHIEITHYAPDEHGGAGTDEDSGLTLFLHDTRGDGKREPFHIVLNKAVATDPYLVHLFRKYVQVVDLPGMGFSMEQWACLHAWVQQVPVVRCMSTEWHNLYPLTHKTLVVFQDALAHQETPCIYMEDQNGGEWNARHLVVNLDCYADPVDSGSKMFSLINEFWSFNTDFLTVVLHDRISMPTEPEGVSYDAIAGYMENALSGEEIKRVAIVGLELFIPDPRKLHAYQQWAVKGVLEENECELSEEECARRFKFYTHEEYKELLGEENYNLYTVK